MISNKMEKALNEQIALEGAAMHKYLAMALWCDSEGLDGSASFFYAQSDEEREHMMKFVHYVQDQDARAIVPTLQQPPVTYESIYDVVQKAYEGEQVVTASIHNLVDLAEKENDRQTWTFLQWFVSEQLEEEVQMRKLLDKMKLIGVGSRALYFIDKEFATIRQEGEAPDAEA